MERSLIMRFIQRYKSPKFIGVSDDVRYKGKDYQVLINYIKGETDAKKPIHLRITELF